MATNEDKTKDLTIIAPSLFDFIDEEELNPPSYTGSDFIGENITIWSWEIKPSNEYGDIVIAQVSTDELETQLSCALTAWRMKAYFMKLMELNYNPPFRVRIVADGKSYKFAPVTK